MLHYKSLLKGRIFKNRKIKSSFLIEDRKESFQTSNNTLLKREESNKIKKKGSTSIKIISKKSSEKINLDNINIADEDQFLSEDYEDLFFYFLLQTQGIDYFEKQIEVKKEKKINNKYIFNYLYDIFTDEKMQWQHFLFPEPSYIILYIKSRKILKEILQYSIYSGKKINDIINAYNKKYTCHKKIKNWHLKPQEACKNYDNIILEQKNETENINKGNNPFFKNVNYTDFVVKTDNNGKGKTLIFLGKAINIYIDDLDKNQDSDKGISMAVEESEFNKKIKNEIIYTFDDIILKTKKRNMTINNNKNELNKLRNKKDKNYFTNFQANMGVDNKNNKFLSLDKKEKNKTNYFIKKPIINNNIFNNYNKHCKLPSIIKIEKQKTNMTDRKIIKDLKYENKDFSNINININNKNDYNIHYHNIFPINRKIKRPKKSINSFSIYERENVPKSHKKIINFFTKENSDFYY